MGADGQHLKLRLLQSGKFFDAVAFSVPDEWKQVKMGDKIDVVYYIDMNEWNGRRDVQLKVVDIKI
jgi:single-stranded-DNA-specific exonuclease